MTLPFLQADQAVIKCRHCGSTQVRPSSKSSGDPSHVTYRCQECKRHFRIGSAHARVKTLIAGAALFSLTLIGLLFLLYLGDADDVKYQPTVNMLDRGALEKTRQAARQGNAQAQYDLGWAHWQRGEYLQAFPLIKAAADQDHSEAEYLLGMAYLEGHGTVQNYRFALEQFTNAAQHSHLEAQYRLGLFYRDGLATLPSRESAYVWLNIAAARGHDDALQFRDKLAAAMSSEEINRAQETSTQTMAKLSGTATGKP
jgi:TPR repeat protein/DNA-directed RNA polymerase subunit RPC12/RpoP